MQDTEIVKFISVSKSFYQGKKEIAILKDANFALDRGEVVALVGPSGSGKTTLLQIIGLLDNADQGEIFVDSQRITDLDDIGRTKLRRNRIGFIYQFHQLLPEFNAWENVALPLWIRGIDKHDSYECAMNMLEEMGLGNRAEHRPAELSGGEQQRVAIARAIVGKPSLILADEPTGNLDLETADSVFQVLLQTVKKYQATLFLVTHSPTLAAQADRRLYIRNGTVQDNPQAV